MRGSSVEALLATVEELLPLVKTNLTETKLKELMGKTPSYYRYKIDQMMLPVDSDKTKVYINGMEMYDIDWTRNIQALHDFIDD